MFTIIRLLAAGSSVRRIFWGLLSIGLVGTSSATTWIVEADPANPEGRVEAAVMQAASGDTIQIGPGVYYEHIPLPVLDLTFIGSSGAEETILDGERDFPGREGSIMYCSGSEERNFVFEGITFRHGRGYLVHPALGWQGGALYLACGSPSAVEFRRCAFVDNIITGTIGRGGAMKLGCERLRIENCYFDNNQAPSGGGSLYVDVEDLAIFGSEFFLGSWSWGGFLECHFGGSPAAQIRIEDCRFETEGGQGGLGCLFDGFDVVLRRNVFLDHDMNCAMALWIYNGTYGELPCHFDFEENVFWYSPASGEEPGPNGGLKFWFSENHIDFRRNTFVRTPIRAPARTVSLEQNIFYGASVYLNADEVSLRCNATWPHPFEIQGDIVIEEGTVEADPLFCDILLPDLHLAEQSPCAPEHSPPGCGLIGALDVNCSITPVVPTSWGRIKHWMSGSAKRAGRR